MKPSNINLYNNCEFHFSHEGLKYILPLDDERQAKIEMNGGSEYKTFQDCWDYKHERHFTETMYIDVEDMDMEAFEKEWQRYILNHKSEWVLDEEPEIHLHPVTQKHSIVTFYEEGN